MGARRDPPRPLPAHRIGQRPSPRILRIKTLPGLHPISAGSLPTPRRVSKRRALMTTADTLWSSSASLSPEVHLPAPPVERAPASLVIARRTARRGCPPSQRQGRRDGHWPSPPLMPLPLGCLSPQRGSDDEEAAVDPAHRDEPLVVEGIVAPTPLELWVIVGRVDVEVGPLSERRRRDRSRVK